MELNSESSEMVSQQLHLTHPRKIIVRINGGINKSKQELQIDIQNRNNIRLVDILKEACRRFN